MRASQAVSGISHTQKVLFACHLHRSQSSGTSNDYAQIMLFYVPPGQKPVSSPGNDHIRMVFLTFHWHRCQSDGTVISHNSLTLTFLLGCLNSVIIIYNNEIIVYSAQVHHNLSESAYKVHAVM
ncbi:Hypothetical predicted protein [Octopus vulgaris]|uniref:Uncharacterized protein n=1 Tax=Octopus vulgaris TaxID=6645 RepID=A0AA36AQ05_OCTVU|nr:Hypothetical predicted protein [Octopus vulgaris]